MPVTIVVGAQWGDEGKGRVADWLTRESDGIARYAGGDNAGHTVVVGDDVFKLHLITGKDYFVEIFDCDSLLEAFMKAKL